MDYSEYVTESFEKLQENQEELYKKYDLNSYANWFYDQASGLLTFSDEDNELNFRYYEVGTYSKVTKTWKWSWDNEYTLKKVKEKLEMVKEFGQKNNFKKLTQGLFDSDEDEGWDFTSISSNLLNGIGAYRPQTERHFIFMVLYEVIDNETAKDEKEKFVDCENHERRRKAFICQHLEKGSKNGFEESFETYEDMEYEYEDDDFQAWCNDCEKIRIKENGFTDKVMESVKLKLVCEKCYFEIKETNT